VDLPSLLSALGLLGWIGYEVLLRRREDDNAATWETDERDRGPPGSSSGATSPARW
jgi:protein-S-isoprenylcysteine O-methyltransferase